MRPLQALLGLQGAWPLGARSRLSHQCGKPTFRSPTSEGLREEDRRCDSICCAAGSNYHRRLWHCRTLGIGSQNPFAAVRRPPRRDRQVILVIEAL